MAQKEHVVINADKRVVVPESLKKLGVQFEHDVNTITFDCPRFWSGADLSTMEVYINYTLPDGKPGIYEVTDVQIDEENEELVHFDWDILRNITHLNGQIAFSICAKNIDSEGNKTHHFNTEICKTTYISPGLCVEEYIEEEYPDILDNLMYDVGELQNDVGELSTNKAEQTEVDELKSDLAQLADDVGYILDICGSTTSTSSGGYFSLIEDIVLLSNTYYTIHVDLSKAATLDTYVYLTEDGANIANKAIVSGNTSVDIPIFFGSNKTDLLLRWYCNESGITATATITATQTKIIDKVKQIEEDSKNANTIVSKFYHPTSKFEDLQVAIENGYYSTIGRLLSDYYHLETPIKSGEKYKIKCKTGANLVAYVVKNSNGTVTRTYQTEDWTTSHDYDVEIDITAEENNGTLYINSIDSNYLSVKKYEDSFETKSKLFGKKLAVAGDSICAGAGYLGGYGKIIADEKEMSLQNVGIGGSTIADYSSDRGKICNMIAQLDDDADYILVNGGVNDASLGVTIGTMTERFDSSFDKTTFIGAMESLCKDLTERFNGKKFAFILVHKMTNRYSNFYTGEDNYYLAQKKVLEKWGVPYIDLNVAVPPLNYISSLADVYTNNGDGWHPNYLGYTTFYTPKIIAMLESI